MPFALPVVFADPVLAAAVAAIILAGYLLIQMIGSLLGTISVGPINIPIGRWFNSIAHSVESWAINAFDHLLAPLGTWLNGLAYDAYHTLSQVVSNISHLGDQIAHIVNTSIPDAISAEFAHVFGIVDSDIGAINRKIDDAVSSLTGDIASTAGATFAHVMGIVDSDIGALHGYVDDAVGRAESIASTALSTAEATITSDISSAIQTAEAAEAAAEAALSKDLTGAIAAAEAAAASAGAYLQGEINGTTAAIAAAAATAAAAVAGVTALANEFTSCAVTTCDGPNNLSNLLNDLLGAAQYAALAAFVAQAIADPGAAAGEFDPAAGGLYTSADQLLSGLLSI